jgi:hypothetical protein
MAEQNSQKLLKATIATSRRIIREVVDAFNKPWTKKPDTGSRLALGKWISTSLRHLAAITILAEEHDLSMVADIHFRQMFEILLQVRYFLSTEPSEREKLAERISAWGCLDYLEKLASIKEHDQVSKGYQEMTEQLSTYDQYLIPVLRAERKKSLHWFKSSYTALARKVSRDEEDLAAAYQLISAGLHGSWDLTIGVISPSPGELDFRGYPDKKTMQRWAADLVDRATQVYVRTWNDIAIAVGAPEVELALESNSKKV